MKNLWFVCMALFLLFSGTTPTPAGASEPAALLPESLAARTEMAANQKTFTLFIHEKDPEKATTQLNTSNDDYAKKGWSVFSILTYNSDSDFQGFFVTYQKSLAIE